MGKQKKPDSLLLGLSFALIIIGMTLLFSISAPFSQQLYGHPFYFLFHQFLFGFLPGAFIGFLTFRFSLAQKLKNWSFWIFLLNLFLIVLVFFPKIGIEKGGARRWLGWQSFSFQPSELLKITFVFYLASWLTRFSSRKTKNKNPLLLFFLLIVSLPSILLIFQPDISTLIIILAVAFLMYFLAETPFWHSLFLFSLGIAFLILLIVFSPYRMERLLILIQPDIDPLGKGYQLKQSLISIGSGGIFGKGWGMSKQKLGFLPHPLTDAPFAVLGEETGFVGSFVFIALFLLFFIRGFIIFNRIRDQLLRFLGIGICFEILFSVFVNIGAMIGLIPLTGTPLPFVSYGGSHIVSEFIQLSILLDISKKI